MISCHSGSTGTLSASSIRTGTVEVGNGALWYKESGNGEDVILFVHGHSLDYRMWEE